MKGQGEDETAVEKQTRVSGFSICALCETEAQPSWGAGLDGDVGPLPVLVPWGTPTPCVSLVAWAEPHRSSSRPPTYGLPDRGLLTWLREISWAAGGALGPAAPSAEQGRGEVVVVEGILLASPLEPSF